MVVIRIDAGDVALYAGTGGDHDGRPRPEPSAATARKFATVAEAAIFAEETHPAYFAEVVWTTEELPDERC
jgi:hypothetical protein